MAKIKNVEGLTVEQVKQEVAAGGKFVVYQYAVSIIFMTFKRPSDIYFIRAGESSFGKSIPFTLITLLFGWWGFPWGPIYSFMALGTNFSGGKDVTAEVLMQMNQG
jgi:hypothetical protein